MKTSKLIIGQTCEVITFDIKKTKSGYYAVYVDVIDNDGHIHKGLFLHNINIGIDEYYQMRGAALIDNVIEQDGYYLTFDGNRIERAYTSREALLNGENEGVEL